MTERSTAERYRLFARHEAHGASPLYEDWALGIAEDDDLLRLIDGLPRPKRQANLIFAAARTAGVPLAPFAAVRDAFVTDWDAIAGTALTHSTQTNEASRCAVLLPTLARLDGPIALLEVGASAGLCLLPDRYSYEFAHGGARTRLDPPTGPSDAVLACDLVDEAPPPSMPEVVWRAGIDLNPLDPRDAEAMAWLETLVWPEHDGRRAGLRAAARIAAADPPRVVAGDLLAELPALAAEAPREAVLVVFHSAVLAYLDEPDRIAFRDLVNRLPGVWISNEGVAVTPGVADRIPPGAVRPGEFVVAVDGAPVAAASPHGRYRRALGSSRVGEARATAPRAQ